MGGGSDWISFTSTSLANFAAQYNFQSIAVALEIMSASVCTADDADCKSGDQLAWVAGTAEAVIFIGAVVGQLSMGFLGDYLSRNNALTCTLLIAAMAAFLSAVAPAGDAQTVYSCIIVFRFIIGIGLGGIYPLTATKSSEDSASSAKGTNAYGSACTFFWQIPGSAFPWVLAYCFTRSNMSTGYRWRMVLGLGAVPAVLAIISIQLEGYFKHQRALEVGNSLATPGGNKSGSSSPNASPRSPTSPSGSAPASISMKTIMTKLEDPDIRAKLIGCGGTWFLFDVVFYGLTLLGGYVINEISNGDDDVSSDANIRNLSSKQAIALSLGGISVIISILLLSRFTLKHLQLVGFFVQGFFMLLFVALFTYLKSNDSNGLFALYCLALMSLQLGVPVTTYALPAAVFDKDIRCTFNGIAAAMGKLGAIVGAYTFYYIAKASIHAVLVVCVVVCLLGAYVTNYCIRDEDLMNDESTRRLSGDGTSSNRSGDATFSPFGDRPISATELTLNSI